MRNEIIEAVKREKLIVIIRGIAREKLIPLAEALYEGGVRLIELTYSADKKISDEENAKNIALLNSHFQGKMIVGAGTVLTPEQVELTQKAGGGFIISPDTCKEVIERTRELSLVSIPGAFSPTEIQSAHKYGADFVKLFPISELPLSYVRAVSAPLSHVKLLAVGGVTPENISDYKKTGVCGFGISSGIIDKKMISEDNFKGISTLAEKYVSLIKGDI